MEGRVQAFVGLGSNLGDRAGYLGEAVRQLDAHPQIRVVQVSPVYETEPHTLTAEQQPRYLNAVAEVCTSLAPEALLDVCLRLEQRAGRVRAAEAPWAARPLDLDLLAYGAETRREGRLKLPHPRLAVRRFVLQPWADLAPHLYVPAPFQATVDELLARCPDTDVPVRTEHVLLRHDA